MKKTLVILCALFLSSVTAWAALSQKYADWPNGPAGYLMTQQEHAAYKQLTTDEQAQQFIDLFWAKRDPNLSTRVNEFKVDFEARVAAADKMFAEKGVRGAMTDRGKVFILMGPPANRGKESLEKFLTSLYGPGRQDTRPALAGADVSTVMFGIAFNRAKGVAEVWLYNRDQIPPAVHIPKRFKTVMFAFFDTEGNGHFELQRRIRDAKWAMQCLSAVPQKDLVHPELTKMPVYPLLPGTTAATPTQLAWLSINPAPWPQGATAGVSPGVEEANIYPAWAFIILPAKVAPADTIVGRLTGPGGKVLGTFQKTVTGLETQSGRLYEVAVPAPAGTSTLELALAAQGSPVAVRKLTVTMENIPSGATYITPMVAGQQVIDVKKFVAGTPFIYGGHHVVPRPDGHFAYTDNLSYFCLIVNPGLNSSGRPDVKMRLKLYFGKQVISNAPYRSLQLSKVEDNVYMFGSQLPLSIMPKGGTYTLKTTVKDFVKNVSRTTMIPIILPPKKK
ncbi:MAG: GWxTD domain-containing protein [Acidobacteria bacterium]|nr:GWxTD domain-containing protein [Acidobacteriota bacterium]